MSRGPSRITLQLVETIEKGLALGAGDLSPTLDNIRVRFSDATGLTLDESKEIIENRLDSALELLKGRGWRSCKYVRYYADTYKGKPIDHPKTDVEISRCVAGSGSMQPTFGLHFHVQRAGDAEPDCELWMLRRVLSIENGDAMRGKNIEDVRDAMSDGALSEAGAKTIARNARVEADTSKRLIRIASGQ